jgi:hypothetical protein
MTHNEDFTERLETYLDEYEGVTPLPDAVRDATRAELPHTKQIGPISGLSRFLSMTLQLPPSARYGLAAAVVLAAALIGVSIFNRNDVGGPNDPSEAQSPSAAPTATGPMSLVEAPTEGDLPAGEYYLDLPAYPARIDFEVPEGWWHFWPGTVREAADVHAILVNSEETGARNGSAWGLSFTLVDQVLEDPCDATAGFMDSSVTRSADSLADAFSSWSEFPIRSVEDVTVGGHSGKRVEIERGRAATCAGHLFNTPAGYQFNMELPAIEPLVNQFTLLDVEGSVLVIWTTDFPGTSAFEVDGGARPNPEAHVEDQDELHDILESIVIEPR